MSKNQNGNSTWSRVWSFTLNADTSVEKISIEIPEDIYLSNNYPNHFCQSTTIEYSIPSGGRVPLMVSDILGREVAVSVNFQKQRKWY